MTVVTAEHTHVVIETHAEVIYLVLVPAHQPRLQATGDNLPDLVDTNLRVVLCPALYLLWCLAQLAPCSPDVFVSLHVTVCHPRGRKVHIKPFSPLALGLTKGCALAGAGLSRGAWCHPCPWCADLGL